MAPAGVFSSVEPVRMEPFDAIALDPPAFAKSRSSVPQALKGYAEVNRRAMRILSPGGVLLTEDRVFERIARVVPLQVA